ncbi:YggT family protein [Chloroflexota bacterium]
MSLVFNFLRILCEILTLAILGRAIMSWFSQRPTNMLTNILYRVTEPILTPLRRIIPRVGMLDFSSLVAIILLQIIATVLP